MAAAFPIVRRPAPGTRTPVLVSVPHYGTQPLPHVTRDDYSEPWFETFAYGFADTFVGDLYGDLHEHGATVLATPFSRMFVDVNRRRDDFEHSRRRGALPPGRGAHPYHARRAHLCALAGAGRPRGAIAGPLRSLLRDSGWTCSASSARPRVCDAPRRPHRKPAPDEGPSGDHRHASRGDLRLGAGGDGGGDLHPPRLRGTRQCQRLYRRQYRGHVRSAPDPARPRPSSSRSTPRC